MCLWSPRARLITTANCVGDGRNTLATYRGGVSECPQHEWLSETTLPSFSLSDHGGISLPTSVPPTRGWETLAGSCSTFTFTFTCRTGIDPRPASLKDERARERKRGGTGKEKERARHLGRRAPEIHRRIE